MMRLDEEKNNIIDETAEYLDRRYIGAVESFWNLLEFPTHSNSPVVERLPVHLPKGQMVFVKPENEHSLQELQDEEPVSMLMAYFVLNTMDETARTMLYTEIPNAYTWEMSSRRWKKRKVKPRGGVCIGRMYNVSIRDGERFYIRLLLNRIKGATSFEDLRTVSGILYPTFHAACEAHGFLESDKHWEETLQEAAGYASPSNLRDLFVLIVCQGFPSNPSDLWTNFAQYFIEDFVYKYHVSTEQAHALAIAEVVHNINAQGEHNKNEN
jgi:hypothetical protein